MRNRQPTPKIVPEFDALMKELATIKTVAPQQTHPPWREDDFVNGVNANSNETPNQIPKRPEI